VIISFQPPFKDRRLSGWQAFRTLPGVASGIVLKTFYILSLIFCLKNCNKIGPIALNCVATYLKVRSVKAIPNLVIFIITQKPPEIVGEIGGLVS